MRTSIENWLLKIWYSQSRPPLYLRMAVPLYRAGFAIDHRKSRQPAAPKDREAPVIVVGNITVGGSGKTPLVAALTGLAQQMQLKVGIASTGYGRESDETLQVLAHSDPRLCGDEPVLLAKRTGALIVVAKRRADAVAELDRLAVDLIISDDGLQTAGFRRDLEICVVDGARGLGNGHLLPAGPLREPAERLQTVDCIVSNGEWTAQPQHPVPHVMNLMGETLYALDDSRSLPVVDFIHSNAGNTVHVVAGIGHPERFFESLAAREQQTDQQTGSAINWQQHRFADHHAYTLADFAGMDAAIVMTEKDAVKCRKLELDNAWYLPVEADLGDDFKGWFQQQLTQLRAKQQDVKFDG